MCFRLPPDQWRRFEKACRQRGQTKQAFVEGIVLAEIANHEERRRDARGLRSVDNSDNEITRSREDVGGLGIASAMRREREEAPPPAAPAPVVVNVGNSSGGSGSRANDDTVERLANYVTSGTAFERERRMRTAVEVLSDNATTKEERKTLAARLDEAVAAKTQKKVSSATSIASVALDKISNFIRR